MEVQEVEGKRFRNETKSSVRILVEEVLPCRRSNPGNDLARTGCCSHRCHSLDCVQAYVRIPPRARHLTSMQSRWIHRDRWEVVHERGDLVHMVQKVGFVSHGCGVRPWVDCLQPLSVDMVCVVAQTFHPNDVEAAFIFIGGNTSFSSQKLLRQCIAHHQPITTCHVREFTLTSDIRS